MNFSAHSAFLDLIFLFSSFFLLVLFLSLCFGIKVLNRDIADLDYILHCDLLTYLVSTVIAATPRKFFGMEGKTCNHFLPSVMKGSHDACYIQGSNLFWVNTETAWEEEEEKKTYQVLFLFLWIWFRDIHF